jgi:cellulose biosynthesis protein BcsQ
LLYEQTHICGNVYLWVIPASSSSSVVRPEIKASISFVILRCVALHAVLKRRCIVEQAREYKETLKCGFVVSRKIGKTVIGRQVREMVENTGMRVFDADIENRVAFAESMTMGQTIFEWGADKKAMAEIETLTKELVNYGKEELSERTETEKLSIA